MTEVELLWIWIGFSSEKQVVLQVGQCFCLQGKLIMEAKPSKPSSQIG